VAVGNDEAISCDDYARADAAVPSFTLDADNGWTDPVGHGGDGARIGIERRFILRVADSGLLENTVRDIGQEEPSKLITPGRVGDGVSAADGVKLVEQRANVELGRVDGNAESLRDRLIRGSLGGSARTSSSRGVGGTSPSVGDVAGAGSTKIASGFRPHQPAEPARLRQLGEAVGERRVRDVNARAVGGSGAACSLKRPASR
jgi:hypothetical protein